MGRFTKRQILILVCFAIADFCSALCISLQAPFYPAEAEKKGATPTEYGLVFGIFQLTVFLTSPIYGRYIGTIGPSFMYTAGIYTTGSTCILFGFLDKINSRSIFIGLSLATRFIEALGSTAFLTASFTLIAAEFPDSVGGTFASLETCYGSGLIFGPTIGGALYELGGYTLPFLTLGMTLVVVAIVMCFIIPSNVTAQESHRESSRLRAILRIPLIAILVYVNLVAALTIGFLQTSLEPHLRPLGLTPFHTGLMFIFGGGAYALSAPVWGFLNDKYILPQHSIGIGSLLSTTAYLLIGPAFFIPFEVTIPSCICSLLIHGIGTASELVGTFTGIQKEAINRGFPDNIETYGLVSGIWTSSFAFGAFLGPTIAGFLNELIGFRKSTLVVVALHILAFISLVLYRCCHSNRIDQNVIEAEENKALLDDPSSMVYGTNEDSCDNIKDSLNTNAIENDLVF